MENNEIKQLKKENSDLKLEVAKLISTLKMESDSTTKHIKTLYERIKLLDDYIGKIDKRGTKDLKYVTQHIADLHDIIGPIEQKIFPAAKNARKQLASIVGPKRLGSGKNWDKKTS